MQNLKWATTRLSRRLGTGHAGGARGARAARTLGALCGALGAGRVGLWGARGVQACSLGAPGHAGWVVGCALGAFSLFLTRFDSVLFLSQFLDIVSEPGS